MQLFSSRGQEAQNLFLPHFASPINAPGAASAKLCAKCVAPGVQNVPHVGNTSHGISERGEVLSTAWWPLVTSLRLRVRAGSAKRDVLQRLCGAYARSKSTKRKMTHM